MNRELEELIKAFDAAHEATGVEGTHLVAIYQSRLDDVLAGRRNLSRERLDAMVRLEYRRWLKAQQKPSTLPPKA